MSKKCEATKDNGEPCKAWAVDGEDYCVAHNDRREWTEQERKFVEAMSAVGAPQEEIAEVLGCTAKTLRKHFRETLDHGAAKANAKVAATLFQMATSGKDTTASIFWAKSRMGWSTTQEIDHKNDGGEFDESSRPIVVLPDNAKREGDDE